MLLKCDTARGECSLVEGKLYTYVRVQEGIFPDRPFVTVQDPDTKQLISCHFYRFTSDEFFLNLELTSLRDRKNLGV